MSLCWRANLESTGLRRSSSTDLGSVMAASDVSVSVLGGPVLASAAPVGIAGQRSEQLRSGPRRPARTHTAVLAAITQTRPATERQRAMVCMGGSHDIAAIAYESLFVLGARPRTGVLDFCARNSRGC